jgi:hypothetical protein
VSRAAPSRELSGPFDRTGGADTVSELERARRQASPGCETTSLRAAVTPGWSDGRFFVRADAGIDLTIDTPDDGDSFQVAHLDGALGAVSGNVAGTLEMQNAWLMGDGDTLRVSHLAGTVQYAARAVNVYGGVGKAFIEDDGFFDDEDIWDLSLGVRGRF